MSRHIPLGAMVLALLSQAAMAGIATLQPLAGLPKLRALEIYHSRITEQGLANLSACRKLDSVQIKSAVPISQQAVARLQTELPSLQTVDISHPE